MNSGEGLDRAGGFAIQVCPYAPGETLSDRALDILSSVPTSPCVLRQLASLTWPWSMTQHLWLRSFLVRFGCLLNHDRERAGCSSARSMATTRMLLTSLRHLSCCASSFCSRRTRISCHCNIVRDRNMLTMLSDSWIFLHVLLSGRGLTPKMLRAVGHASPSGHGVGCALGCICSADYERTTRDDQSPAL